MLGDVVATLSSPAARVTPPGRASQLRIAPEIALAAIGAGALAVIALWWKDTNFIYGLGDWLTNAGRITGLLAGYAVVVLLALMARVPALERGVGTDRLVRWHAMGGRYTVSLALAHTLLIIWGYAVTAHSTLVHQTASLLTTYPDVLMATVSLGLLLVVGSVSARAARRRMKYETWHFIHLYTYLAIALAFSHQFSTGADFMRDVRSRVLWSALYIIVATLLIWYRLLAPVRAALRHRLRVADVRRESANIISVYITGRRLEELRAEPGQFFRWRFLSRTMWWAANPYSLSAPARPDVLRITVKLAGDHSAALGHIRPGTGVLAEGPYGSFTAARRRRGKVLLIAGGVGITPLRSLFETLPGQPGDITLIYRVNKVTDVVFRRELDWIARERGASVHYLVGPPRPGERDQLSATNLQRLIPDLREHDVYLCGPEPMMTAATKALRANAVPRRHIHNESFVF